MNTGTWIFRVQFFFFFFLFFCEAAVEVLAAVGSGKAVRAGAVGRRAEALARGVTRVWVLVPRKLSPD